MRLVRYETTGNPGDVKPMRSGVSEMRFTEGKAARIFLTTIGDQAFLLGGSDKTNQRTQQKQIEAAIALAKDLRKSETLRNEATPLKRFKG